MVPRGVRVLSIAPKNRSVYGNELVAVQLRQCTSLGLLPEDVGLFRTVP